MFGIVSKLHANIPLISEISEALWLYYDRYGIMQLELYAYWKQEERSVTSHMHLLQGCYNSSVMFIARIYYITGYRFRGIRNRREFMQR